MSARELQEGEVEVTCRDWTGDTQTEVIRDDYVIVTAGDRYVDGIQSYPGTGTTVLTIKRKPRSTTFCWLIERGRALRQEPTVWYGGEAGDYPQGHPIWTTDANKALRYPTREAAEAVIEAHSRPIPYRDREGKPVLWAIAVEHGFVVPSQAERAEL